MPWHPPPTVLISTWSPCGIKKPSPLPLLAYNSWTFGHSPPPPSKYPIALEYRQPGQLIMWFSKQFGMSDLKLPHIDERRASLMMDSSSDLVKSVIASAL